MTRMPSSTIILPFPPAGDRSRTAGNHSSDTHPDARRVAPAALVAAVSSFIEAQGGGQGHFLTPMSGVHIMRSFQEYMPIRQLYRPSLCVVIQGAKQFLFGDSTLDYRVMECLVVSIELPASGRMTGATQLEPFLGMTIEFDVSMLREVEQQLQHQPAPEPTPGPCVFVGQVDAPLTDCIVRLARLAHTPEAVPVLYNSTMREICYWLLTGPYGGEMRKLALPESNTERVARAIRLLHESFRQTLRVEQLAEAASMSTSSFHQHFKAMTSMTPVQFQKQLRLLEARRLMVADAANVSEAAFEVGYESASQFSREYTRAFGAAPKRDVMNYKALLAVHSR